MMVVMKTEMHML